MPREFSRTLRVADSVQKILARAIQREVPTPLITITTVTVSRDLAHAKIFFTQLSETPEEIAATLKMLKKMAPFLRHCLAQEIKLRIIPELHFIYDESIKQAFHLSGLIDEAIARDESKNKN